MRKLSYFVMLIAGCSLMFSCIDNDESDSIKKMRDAMAKEIESMAALNDAQAQALLIKAQADADYTAALAQVEAANAAYILAKAAHQEILNSIEEIELQIRQGSVSAEIEAALTKAKALAAQYAADLAESEKRMKEAEYQMELLELRYSQRIEEAKAKYELALLEIKAEIALKKAGLEIDEETGAIASLFDQYYELMKEISEKELEALKEDISIRQAEAELIFAQQVEDFNEALFIKKLEKAAHEAATTLALKEQELAMWEELLPNVDAAKEKIAELEADIVDLKKDWTTAKSELAAAETAYEAAKEQYNNTFSAANFTSSYTSIDPGNNGKTYYTRGTVEGVRSIIPVAKTDLDYLKGLYEAEVEKYNKAVAGIEDAVEADQQAFRNYEYATEMWLAAWDAYQADDETLDAFLAADKAYCIAYSAYWGGVMDTDNNVYATGNANGQNVYRPNGATQILLTTLSGLYDDTTVYSGTPGDPELTAALNEATEAWEEAYDAFQVWEITAPEMIEVDEAYCIAYAKLNGGVADGTQPRPRGGSSFSIPYYASYPDADTYAGTRYQYGDIIGDVDDYWMDFYANACAEQEELIKMFEAAEEAFGLLDADEKEMNDALDLLTEKEMAVKDITDEIEAKEESIRDLKDIESYLAYDYGEPEGSYKVSITIIEGYIKRLTEEIEGSYHSSTDTSTWGLRDKAEKAQLEYEKHEEMWLANELKQATMIEYLKAEIESRKKDLAIDELEIAHLTKMAETLKAVIDELIDSL